MGIGISVHFGLNHVDPHHHGVALRLPYCYNDALAMQTIAEKNGFETSLLVNKDATSYNLFFVLDKAAATLESGDILFISFSGHGCNFLDVNGDEEDGYDEGLIFYDRVVVDDELHRMWANFRPGVRILFISDSCYSGTVVKDAQSLLSLSFGRTGNNRVESSPAYQKNRLIYDARLGNIPKRITPLHCTVLLLSACQDDQVAGAGNHSVSGLSTFTEVLMYCLIEKDFRGTYRELHRELKMEFRRRKITQYPNYYRVGAPNVLFETEPIFTI